ncbi:hypothetical protein [Rudaeicoccus suwonensis]|uniref:Membrane protein YfhO n=1 Tax=Rudaeicoccus suwonensis TaxID=657409 RepID=A0A561EAJ7_9MICO|nr:hypothetical protein [Rudaeicoccus suwonensis]TWE12631.1 hypothetical protein BKA23_1446 [Rudaeicoccus suwonensis]
MRVKLALPGRGDRSTRPDHRALGGLVGLVCGLLALGPALRPGYLLFYDMVFVPRLAFSDRTMGVDGSVPRAVPNDFDVAVLSHLAPGWVVQKVLLIGVFVAVGAGAAGLMRTRLGAVAAALVAAWNPYLAERLAIGHWGYLLGYACVPFLVSAAAGCRSGAVRGRFRLGVWLVVLAFTGSTGAVFGLIAVLAVLLAPGPRPSWHRSMRDIGWALLIWLLADATWWFSYLFLAPTPPGGSAGVTAFMARADTPYGVIGSLLTGGGIWNQGVWFSARSSVVVSGLALLVVVVAVVVAVRRRVWRQSPALAGLGIAGVICLVLAGASALPGGSHVMTILGNDLPGGGLLRDAQKFDAVWMILVAVLAGQLVERTRDLGIRVGAQRSTALVFAAALAAWPLITLTGMAWGAWGRWQAVDYPASYVHTAQQIDRLPPGGVAVFPWTQYRSYAWDGHRVLLDPWQRLVSRQVLVNDALPLTSGVVPGDDPDARKVTQALADHGDVAAVLRSVGVRYVLVETDQPVAAGLPNLAGDRVLVAADGLRLYDLGPVHVSGGHDGPFRYTGWLLAGMSVLLVGVAGVSAGRSATGPPAGTSARHEDL